MDLTGSPDGAESPFIRTSLFKTGHRGACSSEWSQRLNLGTGAGARLPLPPGLRALGQEGARDCGSIHLPLMCQSTFSLGSL